MANLIDKERLLDGLHELRFIETNDKNQLIISPNKIGDFIFNFPTVDAFTMEIFDLFVNDVIARKNIEEVQAAVLVSNLFRKYLEDARVQRYVEESNEIKEKDDDLHSNEDVQFQSE